MDVLERVGRIGAVDLELDHEPVPNNRTGSPTTGVGLLWSRSPVTRSVCGR